MTRGELFALSTLAACRSMWFIPTPELKSLEDQGLILSHPIYHDYYRTYTITPAGELVYAALKPNNDEELADRETFIEYFNDVLQPPNTTNGT